jgi:hypothetical protein
MTQALSCLVVALVLWFFIGRRIAKLFKKERTCSWCSNNYNGRGDYCSMRCQTQAGK